jgi:hypothetical protein
MIRGKIATANNPINKRTRVVYRILSNIPKSIRGKRSYQADEGKRRIPIGTVCGCATSSKINMLKNSDALGWSFNPGD